MKEESKWKSLHDDEDHFEDSDSEGPSETYLLQLFNIYKANPEELTPY
jgi:hypothetical protein